MMGSAPPIPHTTYFISSMFIGSIAKVIKIQAHQQLNNVGVFSYSIMSSGSPKPQALLMGMCGRGKETRENQEGTNDRHSCGNAIWL